MKLLHFKSLNLLANTLGILCLILFGQAILPAETPFYSVTGITAKIVSNAVQITIQTDGVVNFGTDLAQSIDFASGFKAKPVRHFRLRLLGAHARIPAFNDIGIYPVDSAAVTLGDDNFQSPYFNFGATQQGQNDLKVDIDISFYVPVTLRHLDVGIPNNTIDFGDTLQQLQYEVHPGDDRKSIVITVISDRVDFQGAQNLQRSPLAEDSHALNVASYSVNGQQRFNIYSLHTPLSQVMRSVSQFSTQAILVGTHASETDVSLSISDVSLVTLIDVLTRAFDLEVTSDADSNALQIDSGQTSRTVTPIKLRYLTPDQARLLFPDFLLPVLRSDNEHQELDVTGSPLLARRIANDIRKLDTPRQNVKIVAQVYEEQQSASVEQSATVTKRFGHDTISIDPSHGIAEFAQGPTDQGSIAAAIQSFHGRSVARLLATSSIVVSVGATGHLFAGEQRFVQLIQNVNGQQKTVLTSLPIGYTLDVTPLYSNDNDITLDLEPQTATIDEIDPVTGLPVLGTTQVTTSIRAPWGKPMMVAGMDLDLNSKVKSGFTNAIISSLIPFRGIDDNKGKQHILILVTAERA